MKDYLTREGEAMYRSFADEENFFNLPNRIRYESWFKRVRDFLKDEFSEVLPPNLFGERLLRMWPKTTTPLYTISGTTSVSFDTSKETEFLKLFHAQISYLETAGEVQSLDDYYFFELSNDGKLSRNFKNGHEEYAMEQGSMRHKIVKELLASQKSSGYYSTEDLADALHTNTRIVQKQIGDIKKQIEKNFPGILGKDFIASKKGSGYRLGSKVRVRPT